MKHADVIRKARQILDPNYVADYELERAKAVEPEQRGPFCYCLPSQYEALKSLGYVTENKPLAIPENLI